MPYTKNYRLQQFVIIILIIACSCHKGEKIPEANIRLAKSFDSTLQSHAYRLASYMTNTAFDYEPADTVPAKTNHWQYVSWWLKDDSIQFNPSGVIIYQNINKMPSNEGDISHSYKVSADKEGVAFEFLNFTYLPLTYRLVDFSDSTFIVKAGIRGQDVFSTFKVLH